MKILDLFAGPGGTAKGFHSVKSGLQYFAVENDLDTLNLHKENNPSSICIFGDAYQWLDRLEKYDFVWISPPCTTHSRAMLYHKNKSSWKEPDNRLWDIINLVLKLKTAAVVENVVPWYKPKIKPTCKISRHLFWSNFRIIPFKISEPSKKHKYMYRKDWEQYHNMIFNNRKQARNCLKSEIAAEIFKQFLVVKKE